MNYEAIFALYPNVTVIDGETPFDENGNEVVIDMAVIDTWVNPNQYQINRALAYPSIQEQLDMQYWDSVNGTTTWKDAIATVKTENPKP